MINIPGTVGVIKMLFRDKNGRLLSSEQVDQMPEWKIEELEIHVDDDEEAVE
jgi:hypothetical protein